MSSPATSGEDARDQLRSLIIEILQTPQSGYVDLCLGLLDSDGALVVLAKPWQVLVLSACAAVGKELQQREVLGAKIFGELTELVEIYVDANTLEGVHGFAQDCRPRHQSWEQDVEHCFGEIALLFEAPQVLRQEPELREITPEADTHTVAGRRVVAEVRAPRSYVSPQAPEKPKKPVPPRRSASVPAAVSAPVTRSSVRSSSGPTKPAVTASFSSRSPQAAIQELADIVADAAPFSEVRPYIVHALETGAHPTNRRLVSICGQFLGVLEGREFRGLRRAIRDAAEREKQEEVSRSVLEGWDWAPYTKGKKCLIVGADARGYSQQAIQEAFEFSEVDWPNSAKGRNRVFQGYATRIRHGTAGDIVLLLVQWLNNDARTAVLQACRDADMPHVVVDTGYGVSSIKRSIERALPKPVAARRKKKRTR